MVVANSGLSGGPICTNVKYRIGPVAIYETDGDGNVNRYDANGNMVATYVTETATVDGVQVEYQSPNYDGEKSPYTKRTKTATGSP